jgi:hypothetical protein
MWKRLLLKINVMFQMLAMQVKTKTILGEKAYDALFQMGPQKLTAQNVQPVRYRFIRGQVVGQALPRGQGKKDSIKAHMDPAMCLHPEKSMMARGNAKTQWWTCQVCLSRWARLAQAEVTTQTGMPQDQDLVIFGKYTGSTYLEVLQDATYCNWIMDTMENDSGMMKPESSEQFQRLAQYIHLHREAETWAGDDSDLEM